MPSQPLRRSWSALNAPAASFLICRRQRCFTPGHRFLDGMKSAGPSVAL